MESTGVYWKPVYYTLEDGVPEVLLVNATHVAKVPGRKTDVSDSVWIAQLLECGLLRGSFVPPPVIRELRDLTRYRKTLIQDRTRAANRLHKVLEDAGLKLATVATDVLGASGRAMLTALVEGTTDPGLLADLARGRLRAKLPALRQALTGRFRGHHAFLLTQLLAHLDYLDEAIATLSHAIEEHLAPFAEAAVRLRPSRREAADPGGDHREIGVTSSHGRAPAVAGSAGTTRRGKRRRSRCAKKRWLKAALVEASLAAIRTKGSSLGAVYRRICRHAGHNVAVVAVAHAILEIAWHLLAQGTTYRELGADYLHRRNTEQTARRHVRFLETLGYRVTLEPLSAAA
jgi:transposase